MAVIAVFGPFAAAADANAPATAPSTDPDATVEVVVGFHDDPDPDLVRAYGGEVNEVLDVVQVVVADVPASALAPLEREQGVASVERDDQVRLEQQSAGSGTATGDVSDGNHVRGASQADGNQVRRKYQTDGDDNQTVPWGVSRVGADAVHENGTTGDGIVVAVLDTGVDADHPDLEDSYAGGVDVVNGDDDPEDDHGHGTHVAGTIAATDDGHGVVGVAPDVSLYGVKVLNDSGEGTHSDILAGIEWAIRGPDGVVGTEDDADVVSMSLGGFVGSEAVHRGIKRAYDDHGILVVAGAGDAGRMDQYEDTVMAPARYSQVIAVGAVDRDDRVPAWSGFGEPLELVAPGVAVESTAHGGTLPGCGTSMATPHVTGVAALVYESDVPPEADADDDGEWDAVEVRTRLRETAVDIGPEGRDVESGFGRVWAPAAVGAPAGNERPAVTEVSIGVPESNPAVIDVRATVRDRETDVGDLDVFVLVDDRELVRATYNASTGVHETRVDARQFDDVERHQVVVIVRDVRGAVSSEVYVGTVAAVADSPQFATWLPASGSPAPAKRAAIGTSANVPSTPSITPVWAKAPSTASTPSPVLIEGPR